MEQRVYIRGKIPGLRGIGSVVKAIRNEEPDVKKGLFYTIKDFKSYDGACAKCTRIVLEGIEGDYSPKTFRFNRECAGRIV